MLASHTVLVKTVGFEDAVVQLANLTTGVIDVESRKGHHDVEDSVSLVGNVLGGEATDGGGR